MDWFVVHTKPRQEARAQLNLERQGFTCFLPTFAKEKLTKQALEVVREPLFSRYLFIELDTQISGKSWSPIRSTLGVSKLVSFGMEPARVDRELIALLRDQENKLIQDPKVSINPAKRLRSKRGHSKACRPSTRWMTAKVGPWF